MSIHPELLVLMEDAWVQDFTGQDAAGNNTYGASRVVKARIEGAKRSMNTSAGDQGTTQPTVVRTCRLIVDYVGTGIVEKSRVTAPDGVTYSVVEATTEHDENGPYYQELQCSTNMER